MTCVILKGHIVKSGPLLRSVIELGCAIMCTIYSIAVVHEVGIRV